MGQSLQDMIQQAIDKAKLEGNSREMSLVITKLQESLMWSQYHLEEMRKKVKEAGVGIR